MLVLDDLAFRPCRPAGRPRIPGKKGKKSKPRRRKKRIYS